MTFAIPVAFFSSPSPIFFWWGSERKGIFPSSKSLPQIELILAYQIWPSASSGSVSVLANSKMFICQQNFFFQFLLAISFFRKPQSLKKLASGFNSHFALSNKMGHLFMCLFAIYMLSLMRNMFKSFVHFFRSGCLLCIDHFKSYFYNIHQGLANNFYTRPVSKYFRFWGPHTVCHVFILLRSLRFSPRSCIALVLLLLKSLYLSLWPI